MFWMNIYGPQVTVGIMFGGGYIITGRLARELRPRLIRKWDRLWTTK